MLELRLNKLTNEPGKRTCILHTCFKALVAEGYKVEHDTVNSRLIIQPAATIHKTGLPIDSDY